MLNKCPLCGKKGKMLFTSFECENKDCKNYDGKNKYSNYVPDWNIIDDDHIYDYYFPMGG